MRRIPPLGSVEAFIAASRERSFRAAANRLALSPSAFSRRIQLLEAFVGTALFDRSGVAPVLTGAGERYLRDLEPAVDVIRRGTDALRSAYRRQPLRVSASLSVATSWLLPRLRGFLDAHDGVAVMVVTGHGIDSLHSGDADIAIFGDSAPPAAFPADVLITPRAIPLAAPQWVAEQGLPPTLEALAGRRLLGVTRPKNTWATWFGELGHRTEPDSIVHYDSIVMMYEAAAAGLGIALGAPLAVERFVEEGRLVRCFEHAAPIDSSYYVAFADVVTRRRPDAQLFADWLKIEAAESGARFAAGALH